METISIYHPSETNSTQLNSIVGSWTFVDNDGLVNQNYIEEKPSKWENKYFCEWYFDADGSFSCAYFYFGTFMSGHGRISGRFAIEGNRMYLTDQIEDWTSIRRNLQSYKNKPVADQIKLLDLLENGLAETLIAVENNHADKPETNGFSLSSNMQPERFILRKKFDGLADRAISN